MSERPHPKNTPAAMEHFRNQLVLISYFFRESGLVYSLVGGLAIEDCALPYRSNGTPRDIDVLSLGPDKKTADAINHIFDHIRSVSDPEFPEVGLESAHFEEVPHSLFASLTGTLVENGNVYMTYRGLKKKLPPETLETSSHMVNGVEFQRFPEMTLLLRYFLRGAVLKPKDEMKVVKLLLKIMENAKSQPDLKYYIPYVEFIYEIREKYPLITAMYSLYWMTDKLLGGRLSGAKGIVYDMIPRFRS